ncbi:hypothetical protein Q8A64_19000, partial [Oxalobacteraceae bacterium R-40]|nr:hypothetical protein [Oxalobacteraceae bacterium R-40]
VDSVKRVTDIMAEITAASNEQSAGIEQVNQAIAQMDQVTQQNAALVEQAAAAAESMQHQAASLTQTVSVFKLLGFHGMAVPVAMSSAKNGTVVQFNKRKDGTVKSVMPVSGQKTRAIAGGSPDWEEF